MDSAVGDPGVVDGPQVLVLQGAQQYAADDLEGARATWEEAFAALRDAGELRAAARVGVTLASLHGSALGSEAVGRGWVERTRRVLEEVGPCVEWGYLELAWMACDRPDVVELLESAERALAIAREHGDPALEVRALADSSLALVTQGRLREGLARFDEVLAALGSGEVSDVQMVGTSLCSLLTSCDRVGDVERAMESVRLSEALLLGPSSGRPRVLGTHCRIALGAVMLEAGRWAESEAALLDALGPDGTRSRTHRVQASARLAELRLHQGRVEEAAAVLAPYEDALEVAEPLARVHLARGDIDLAAAVLRGAVKRMTGDVLRCGRLTSALVETEIAGGDTQAAGEAAVLLRSMATAVDIPLVTALADLSDGRLARAAGELDGAVDAFERASDHLADGSHPTTLVAIHLELAGVHGERDDSGAAVVAARAAHAAALRLGAPALVDRAAATLRQLGATPPRPPRSDDAIGGLTSRELDVLAGIQRGDSNAEIAAALHLAPKTVEHHVGRILAKLGVRTRAEAAAVAVRAGTGA